MSSSPAAGDHSMQNENRRLHARQKFQQLAYARLGPENGGILFNVSEGGLSFQGIGTVDKDQLIPLDFKLPGTGAHIEVTGQVVWFNDSRKGGGLRFLDLSEEKRRLVQEWMASHMPSDSCEGAATKGPEPRNAGGVAPSERSQFLFTAALEQASGQKKPLAGATARANEAQQSLQSHEWPQVHEIPQAQAAAGSNDQALPAKAPGNRLLTVFATGVLTGGMVVLATIVSMRWMGMVGRPATAAIGQSSSEPRPVVAESQASRAEGAGTSEGGSQTKGIAATTAEAPARTASAAATTATTTAAPAAPAAAIATLPSAGNSSTATARHAAPASGAVGSGPARAANVSAAAPGTPARTAERQNPSVPVNQTLLAPHAPAEAQTEPERPAPPAEVGPPLIPPTNELARVTSSLLNPPRPVQPTPAAQPTARVAERAPTFMEAIPIAREAPVYHNRFLRRRAEGVVQVSATIGTDGVPRGLKTVSGDARLAQAAQEAISHWRYIPAVRGGVPVESDIVISVNFGSKP